jgi:protein required for attachment to host cells
MVIADATQARIFSLAAGHHGPLQLVRHFEHPLSRARDQDINSDEPGRLQKSMVPGMRSAMEPRTDAHVVEVNRFVREICQFLREGVDQRQYDDLVLVAPPRFLGLLRGTLPGKALKCLSICVARNCTHVDQVDLPDRLHEIFPSHARTVETEHHIA